MKQRNRKTTLFGILIAGAGAVSQTHGMDPLVAEIAKWVTIGSTLGLGIVASDAPAEDKDKLL